MGYYFIVFVLFLFHLIYSVILFLFNLIYFIFISLVLFCFSLVSYLFSYFLFDFCLEGNPRRGLPSKGAPPLLLTSKAPLCRGLRPPPSQALLVCTGAEGPQPIKLKGLRPFWLASPIQLALSGKAPLCQPNQPMGLRPIWLLWYGSGAANQSNQGSEAPWIDEA